MKIEVLYFEGCPHYEGTVELVHDLSRELGVEANVVVIEVQDEAQAQRRRFLGSPTVRVDGRDVEPGAEQRQDYGLG